MDNNSNNDFGQPIQPDMNQQYDQPMQSDMNQQNDQTVMSDMSQQFGQPMQPDMSQQYGQPMQPDMSQQYGQPMQPDMSQQFGQPMQPDMSQQFGQPMQPDMSQQFAQPIQPGVAPMQPTGKKAKKAKGPKKPLGKGAIAGIICGGVALIAAIVCGIIFIPKLFKSDKEVVIDAMEATFAASNNSYFEETFGSETMAEKIVEEGGSFVFDFAVDEIAGASDFNGIKISSNSGQDNAAKKLGFDLVANYNDTDILTIKFYGDENNTYVAVPDAINGYFTIPNKDALNAIINSPIGQAANLEESMGQANIPNGDINYFPDENGEVEINSEAVALVDQLWENITFEKQGKAKIDVNGETVSAKEYYVTVKEEDIEDLLIGIMDIAASTYDAATLEQMGVDQATMDQSMTQIKSIIPTIVSGDFVLKVYIKDGKVLKISTSDDINVMGVAITYDCYLDITKDLGGKFEFGVMGETAGVTIDLKDYETAPTGEIVAYAAGEEIKLTLESTSVDDDSKMSLDTKLALFNGSEELATGGFYYNFNKSDYALEYGVNITIEGTTGEFTAKGKYTDVVKDESLTLELSEIDVALDGETVFKASGKIGTSTEKKVPELDTSLPTYDLTTMTEADFENMILDNADNIQAWMEKLQDCGLGDLVESSAQEPATIEEDVDTVGDDDTSTSSDDMESVLECLNGTNVEILNCIPRTEKTYGCAYFIDYGTAEGDLFIEYTVESGITAEDFVNSYVYYDEESIVSQETGLSLVLMDGSTVAYSKYNVNEYDTEKVVYVFAKEVADDTILVSEVTAEGEIITVEDAAGTLADENFSVQ